MKNLSNTKQDRIQKDLDQVYIKLEQLIYRMTEYEIDNTYLENHAILEQLHKLENKAGIR